MKMKTNFKYVMLMAVALAMGFSSCGNEEETAGGQDNGTPKSLFLKISSSPETYAEGAAQGATPVTFTSGVLYFVNGTGTILGYYTLSSSATDITTGGSNIQLSDIQSGTTITNLPGAVTTVHIVGNVPTGITLPSTGNISAVKNQALQVTTQGTITNVTLYAENNIPTTPTTAATPTTNAIYDVSVNLKPLVARIELTNIEAGGVIESFQVDGIFVDNYYSQTTIGGTFVAGDLVSNGASTTAFNDGSTEYPNSPAASSLKTIVYDWYNSGLASVSKVVAPSSGVWGYNLFANATGSTVPRIIIRLSNFTTTTGSNVTIASPQYITIKGLKNGVTPLTTIEAGKVYNIGAGLFAFDETNLTPTPNLSTIDVNVTVTLATWTVVNVTPEL